MSIFKACDIRGRYPDEINPPVCARVGRALADLCERGTTVLVGGDVRTHTPALKAALIAGLEAGDVVPVDLGIVPTPVAYFAYRTRQSSALAIVTASHNPPAYNGVKFMIGGQPVDEEIMAELRRRVVSLEARPQDVYPSEWVRHEDPLPDYRAWLVKRFGHRVRQGRPVVLDAGHGCYSGIAGGVCRDLGYQVRALFDTPDGRFPGRSPDSANPAHLRALADAVRATPGAVGLAFDGDGDRVTFIDECGRAVRAEAAALLLLRHLVPAGSGERVVYDNKASMVLAAGVREHGCVPLIERSGHAFIRRRMLEENALFGCEVSGHLFYRELLSGDDGLFSGLLLLESLGIDEHRLCERVDAIPVPSITPDIRVPLDDADPEIVFTAIRRQIPPAQLSDLDGLRIVWDDGWALVRRSVTEPVLTLRFEGRDDAALGQVLTRFAALVPALARFLPR